MLQPVNRPLSVLCPGGSAALAGAAQQLDVPGLSLHVAPDASGARQHDAVLFTATDAADLLALQARADLAPLAFDQPVLVLAPAAPPDLEDALLLQGVQALVEPGDAAALARAVRHAVARKRAERAARHAYATDLATGLPHQAQLVEHMTQLLALREREPAPMVLLVLRVQGRIGSAEVLAGEGVNILRRKVAVRLRSLLRASDVVAAIGTDAFGVLLGRLEAAADGSAVAAKLVRHLQKPLVVAGQPCSVGVSVGLAQYPEHGRDADSLLRRASAQAGQLATPGTQGWAMEQAQPGLGAAANDGEGPAG